MMAWALAVVLSVTNYAGRAVTGDLTSVTNGSFVLAGRTYPLAALPPSERERVVRALDPRHTEVMSFKEKRLRAAVQRDLDRARVRYEAGEISEEAWVKKQAEATAAMRHIHLRVRQKAEN